MVSELQLLDLLVMAMMMMVILMIVIIMKTVLSLMTFGVIFCWSG